MTTASPNSAPHFVPPDQAASRRCAHRPAPSPDARRPNTAKARWNGKKRKAPRAARAYTLCRSRSYPICKPSLAGPYARQDARQAPRPPPLGTGARQVKQGRPLCVLWLQSRLFHARRYGPYARPAPPDAGEATRRSRSYSPGCLPQENAHRLWARYRASAPARGRARSNRRYRSRRSVQRLYA